MFLTLYSTITETSNNKQIVVVGNIYTILHLNNRNILQKGKKRTV